jgi:hypothetical protein
VFLHHLVCFGFRGGAGGTVPSARHPVTLLGRRDNGVALAGRRDRLARLSGRRDNRLNLSGSQAVSIKGRFESYRGEDVPVTVQLTESAAGWSTRLKVAAERGAAAVLTKPLTVGADPTQLTGSIDAAADYTNLPVAGASTDYYLSVERYDTGENVVLSDYTWKLKARPAV